MAEKLMGCLRVELAEHEGHDLHELQLEVDRGILSAQPDDGPKLDRLSAPLHVSLA